MPDGLLHPGNRNYVRLRVIGHRQPARGRPRHGLVASANRRRSSNGWYRNRRAPGPPVTLTIHPALPERRDVAHPAGWARLLPRPAGACGHPSAGAGRTRGTVLRLGTGAGRHGPPRPDLPCLVGNRSAPGDSRLPLLSGASRASPALPGSTSALKAGSACHGRSAAALDWLERRRVPVMRCHALPARHVPVSSRRHLLPYPAAAIGSTAAPAVLARALQLRPAARAAAVQERTTRQSWPWRLIALQALLALPWS
jgi:hypothetical protein